MKLPLFIGSPATILHSQAKMLYYSEPLEYTISVAIDSCRKGMTNLY